MPPNIVLTEIERLRAVNAALVEALEMARTHVKFFCDETDDEGTADCLKDLAMVDAALALAKGEKT